MTDINNNLNLNNVRSTSYKPGYKSEEEVKPQVQADVEVAEITGDGTKAAESYGRVLVKQTGRIDNPETVQCVKDSIDFLLKNPDVVAAAVKSADDAYDLLSAMESADAYEKACCGSCDAAYAKSN